MERDELVTDPINLFLKWYETARTGQAGQSLKDRIISRATRVIRRLFEVLLPWSNLFRPDVATLATITPENRPAARSVLFKGLVHGGFSFYTDGNSNKAAELSANPWAVLVFYWHFPPRQVRIDGRVLKLSRKEVEADWSARKRENQAAASALPQSSVIKSRADLVQKVKQIKHRYQQKPIPCPDSWSGYYLIPAKIEFWEGRLDWMHIRERYVVDNNTWQKVMLAP